VRQLLVAVLHEEYVGDLGLLWRVLEEKVKKMDICHGFAGA